MGVIVNDDHATRCALVFEASLRAPEFPESRPYVGQVQPQVVGHGDGRQGVLDVVQPRQLQAEGPHGLSLFQSHEIASPEPIGSYLHRLPIHTRPQTISDNLRLSFLPLRPLKLPNHRPHPIFIPTAHDTSILWHQADEFFESFGHLVQVTEAIGMVHLDDRDHGEPWLQSQESVIVFVGLDDKVFPLPCLGVGPQVFHHAAHDEGRVQARLGQEPGDQGRGGGLAMGASHSDAVATHHHTPQHLVALDDRYPSLPGRHHLGVVGLDGRGHDDQLG